MKISTPFEKILRRCKRKKEREHKKQKKDNKRKAEEMRDAAMVALGSYKLKVNSLYRTDYFMSHKKHQAGKFEKIIKPLKFKIQ